MVSLIIGLGNAGIRYAETRHNLGFDLLDLLSRKWKIRPASGLGDYHFAEMEFDGRTVRLVWPTTYVNNSGMAAVQSMVRFDLTPADILVAYDDFALPLGKIRIRTKGSDGGHNGIESVIANLGTDEIVRLRMGIGPLPEGIDPTEFVLGRFTQEETEIKNKMLEKAAEIVLYLFKNRPEAAMSLYNQDPASDEQ